MRTNLKTMTTTLSIAKDSNNRNAGSGGVMVTVLGGVITTRIVVLETVNPTKATSIQILQLNAVGHILSDV